MCGCKKLATMQSITVDANMLPSTRLEWPGVVTLAIHLAEFPIMFSASK